MRMMLMVGLIVNGKLDSERQRMRVDFDPNEVEPRFKLLDKDIHFIAHSKGTAQVALWRYEGPDPIAICFTKAVQIGERVEVVL